MSNNEYSSPTVNGSSCSYTTLKSYNRGSKGMSPPVPATTVSGYYIVPTWNHRPSYDTLVKSGSCSGYAGIGAAYGKNADSCNPKYVQRACNK
jgi:hypothetical protein